MYVSRDPSNTLGKRSKRGLKAGHRALTVTKTRRPKPVKAMKTPGMDNLLWKPGKD